MDFSICSSTESTKLEAQLAPLRLGNRRRRAGHDVQALLRFGEGDDVPDGRLSAQKSHEAVQAQSESSVRRSPVLQGLEQKSELLLGRFGRNLQQLENQRLAVGAMNTEAASADLHA